MERTGKGPFTGGAYQRVARQCRDCHWACRILKMDAEGASHLRPGDTAGRILDLASPHRPPPLVPVTSTPVACPLVARPPSDAPTCTARLSRGACDVGGGETARPVRMADDSVDNHADRTQLYCLIQSSQAAGGVGRDVK